MPGVAARATVVAGAVLLTTGILAAPAALARAETITAQVTTAHPMVDQPLTIQGQVSGAASSPSTVTVTRDDSSGTDTPVGAPVMTASDGTFSIEDSPPARGTVTYHLSADGGAATVDVRTDVAGTPTNLSVTVAPHPADAGRSVKVVAHLGSATTNRDVTLFAKPYGQSRQQFDSGPVDANGNRTASHQVSRRTTFIAGFSGDDKYAPAAASITLTVRAVIAEQLRGGYATRNGYRLYHRGSNVNVFIHLMPEDKGDCIVMRAQRRDAGKWHDAAVSGCGSNAIRTNAQGEVIAQLQGQHVVGVPYRLRAEYRGTSAVAPRQGAWLRLLFKN